MQAPVGRAGAGPAEHVALLIEVDLLALQLGEAGGPLGRQAAGGHRRLDRAAGLLVVGAVAEAAQLGQRGDVGEGALEALVAAPEPQLAHARGVDDEAALRQHQQLAVGRGVPALAVVADLGDGQALVPEPAVDQRRLADPRGADQRGRLRAVGVHVELGEAGPADAADHVHGDRRAVAVGVLAEARARGRWIGAQVDLGQHHRGRGAALERDRQQPLDAPQVQRLIERAHQEHAIDVGRHQLLARAATGGLARQLGVARQHGVDRRARALARDGGRDPVADRRPGRGVLGDRPTQATREVGPQLDQGPGLAAELHPAAEQHVPAAVLRRDPRQAHAGRPRLGEVLGDRGREPQALQDEVHGRHHNRRRGPRHAPGRLFGPRLTITFFEPVCTTGFGSAKRRTQARPPEKGWALS